MSEVKFLDKAGKPVFTLKDEDTAPVKVNTDSKEKEDGVPSGQRTAE